MCDETSQSRHFYKCLWLEWPKKSLQIKGLKTQANTTATFRSPSHEFCFIWCSLHNRVIYHVHALCYFYAKSSSHASENAGTCYITLELALFCVPAFILLTTLLCAYIRFAGSASKSRTLYAVTEGSGQTGPG